MANRIILNQTSYHGAGAIKELPTEVKFRGLKKALICCGPTLLCHGVIAHVTDVLDAAGLSYEIYSDIKPNPTIENVTDGIAHSMAHTLGAVYDTPHGVACAMMLPIVMEYNADCTGEKYREIARAMGVAGVDSMTQAEYRKAAVDAVKKLSKDVGIPEKLEALKEEDLPFLAESAYADACRPGNPKDTSVADMTELFRKLM